MRPMYLLLGLLAGLLLAAVAVRFELESWQRPQSPTPAPSPLQVIIQPMPVEMSAPKHGTPRQFNGQTYYIIPISTS